ncbi:MAG TPA: metallophosphoesterase [Lentimicrobium sp.]|nr:metallophosphoesterase [Lentimicrobium sp.]
MKSGMFALFFSIVLLVYFFINFYIYKRGMLLIPSASNIRSWVTIVFWVVVASYVLGRVIERFALSGFTDILTWIGSFWLAAMLYFFLAVLVIDILRVSDAIFKWFPSYFFSAQFKSILLYGISGFVVILVIGGHINAVNPKIRQLNLDIPKSANGLKELNLVMVSDIHLGTVIGPRRLGRLVNEIQKLKPDMILLAGDVVDEDLQPVIRHNLGETLRKLKAPLGVYAITGNHEYIGGVSQAVKYLEEHDIKFLRDSAMLVDDAFYIAGREDRSKNYSGKRKEIDEILNGRNTDLPVIMMDHQPFELNKVAEAGIDLQFSGHTHHGQLWPLNYITEAIYEVSMGYKKKGNSHFYVSNGYGSWGPPVRIGNRPEIVFTKIRFNKN